MIIVDQVSKYFGKTKAVNNISFEVKEGENLILLGTSGCGKTTTLRMINLLIAPSEGTISVNGVQINSQSPEELRRGIGYVLQQNGLFPHYTVAENIAIVPHLLHWDKQKITARTRQLMEKLKLSFENLSDCYPDQLSGGQQQRVNVARALAADPPVLLMDEPFGSLDPVTRAGIRKEFSELDEFRKKTIVMVTHDVQEAFELGDKICLMDKGQIMQIGAPADLLFRPANEFVKNFLAEQYLQLALKSVRLSNVWHLLGQSFSNSNGHLVMQENTTLWDALQQNIDNDKPLAVQNNANEYKEIRADELLNVFYKYKKN